MNERIKELMQQAGTDCSGKWMGMNHAEKFAELIVQECVEAARTVGGSAGVEMETIIRNRFGVKE